MGRILVIVGVVPKPPFAKATLAIVSVQLAPTPLVGLVGTGCLPVEARQKVPCGALVWLYCPTRCQRVWLRRTMFSPNSWRNVAVRRSTVVFCSSRLTMP